MTRASMPRTTVQGFRKRQSGGWDVRADGSDAAGYLRITDITASTPHEFRKSARQLENEGARALILDLRGLRFTGSLFHPAVLLADSLLDKGAIGRVRTVEREMSYEADSDALLQDWPIAVLIDEQHKRNSGMARGRPARQSPGHPGRKPDSGGVGKARRGREIDRGRRRRLVFRRTSSPDISNAGMVVRSAGLPRARRISTRARPGCSEAARRKQTPA